jgi:hypothetical protein
MPRRAREGKKKKEECREKTKKGYEILLTEVIIC